MQSVPDKATAQAVKVPAKKSFAALYAHLVWLETASAADVALDLWAPNDHDSTRRALNMARFMRFTAPERLTALLAIKEGTGRNWTGDEKGWLTPTVSDMMIEAPEDVVRLLTRAGVPDDTTGLLDKLFAKQGYDGCLAFLNKLPDEEQDRLRGAAVTLLAKKGLTRALAESLKVPEGSARNGMVEAVANLWAETDPRAALAWAAQHGKEMEGPHGGSGSNPARSLLAALFLKDPKLGGELLLENQGLFGGSYGPDTLSQTFQSWAARDYDAAAKWLAANPLSDNLHDPATDAVFSTRLKTLKGAEALQFFESLPAYLKGDCSDALVAAVGVSGLPGGLVAFSEALPESERLNFLSSLRYGPAALTTEQIKTILPMLAKLDTYGHATRDYLSKLPEADLVEFQPLLPTNMQAEVSIQAAKKALDAGDLETAKALLSKTGGAKQTLPYVELALTLAQDQPDEAVAWIASLKEGDAKNDATSNLAANWAIADLAAASAWVEKLPPGKARDEAVAEITVLHALSGNTAAALALAASVQSEPARLTAFANAARNAWFQDAAGTEAVLTGHGLSKEQLQKVTAGIQEGVTH